MLRGPRAWFLRRLDAFLPEARRQALSTEQLSRYRVLLGATWVLLALTVLYLLALPVYQAAHRPFHAALGLTNLGCYGLVLVLIRRGTSPRLPALVLCSVVTLAYLLATQLIDSPTAATHVSTVLIPMLAVYLLGARMGLFFTLPFVLNAAILHRLTHGGLGSGLPLAQEVRAWAPNLMAGFSLLLGWALGWLHSSARGEAVEAQEQALRTLRESEGKLLSLLESTDDIVCAVDLDGRVLTHNQASRQLFQRLFGRDPLPDERFYGALPAELQAHWRERIARAMAGERVREEVLEQVGGKTVALEFTINPVRAEGGRVVGLTLFGRDISARKEAEKRLSEMHRSLMDASRQAGMAEIATGILHNVGNTLNSVNVSAGLVAERLRGLRVTGLSKAVELLRENAAGLGPFLTEDSRGRQLPVYLGAFSEQLTQEREALLTEVRSLSDSLEHIKAVVSMQQQHARSAGLVEQVTVSQLIDDALHLHAVSFERLGIQVRREFAPMPPLLVDRHKLLQILLNLLSNARHALLDSPQPDKQLTIRVGRGSAERLRIAVEDNGVGITPEHLPRIFTQGFTTKRTGHGFGLHISALAAEEMGGALTCASPGPGLGAAFTLEIPPAREESHTP
jgi:PAS domain S-box-containing protein